MKKDILATTFVAGLVLLGLSTSNAKAADINDEQSVQTTSQVQNQQPTNSINLTNSPSSDNATDVTNKETEIGDVNEYINKNNLPYSGVKDETAQSTFTAGKDYRYGKPEGIVVHETAKPNISAQEWTDIFNQNWKTNQSYVHAFVDKDSVIQTAPTNKTVWGSGYYGNQRFIQVELCEEDNEQDFAQSIQNDATYIAHLLHQYNLKPSLADGTGNGTIWSHHDVTKYLGDTTHTDPDGYFALHNYSMQQFFNLINQRYNEITPLYNQSKIIDQKGVVQINYSGKGKVAVWDAPEGNHHIVKYVNKNTKWNFFKTANINGNTWYNLGGNQWVDGRYAIKNISTGTPSNQPIISNAKIENINSSINIQYTGKGQVAVWNGYGNNKKIVKYVPKNSSWKAYQVVTLADNSQWYNLGGNQWVSSKYAVETNKVVNKPAPSLSNTNTNWTINNVNNNVKINYTGKGQVAVWDGYGNNKKIVKYVPKNSSWKVLKEATPQNGYVWYNLGGDQWITSEFTNAQKVVK